jgi:hypothetical protein
VLPDLTESEYLCLLRHGLSSSVVFLLLCPIWADMAEMGTVSHFDYERPDQAVSAISSTTAALKVGRMGFGDVALLAGVTFGFVVFAATVAFAGVACLAGVVRFTGIVDFAGFAVSVALWEVVTFVIKMPALSNIGASAIKM